MHPSRVLRLGSHQGTLHPTFFTSTCSSKNCKNIVLLKYSFAEGWKYEHHEAQDTLDSKTEINTHIFYL